MPRSFRPIYLASGSPRRRELLTQLGIPFDPLAVDIREHQQSAEAAADYVRRLAVDKAAAGLAMQREQGLPTRPVLGADTAVVIDGEILGKPTSQTDGLAMLRRLSGNAHQVYSGIALTGPSVARRAARTALSISTVRFSPLSEADIQAYWDTGEGVDKAGCYAVQGLAAEFIQHIDGSYSGIMGLPLFETACLLRHADSPDS